MTIKKSAKQYANEKGVTTTYINWCLRQIERDKRNHTNTNVKTETQVTKVKFTRNALPDLVEIHRISRDRLLIFKNEL